MSDGKDVEFPDLSEDAPPPDEAAPAPAQPASAEKADSPAEAATLDDDEGHSARDLEAVFDVPVNISAVLGRTHIEVNDLLKLENGMVLELDRKIGEAIDIFVNDRLVARGEVVVVEDRLGVTMTEIIKGDQG